jgi:hypothetical protein
VDRIGEDSLLSAREELELKCNLDEFYASEVETVGYTNCEWT